MEFIRLSKHSKNSLDFLIYSWNSSYSDFHVVTYVTFEGISNKLRSNENFSEL